MHKNSHLLSRAGRSHHLPPVQPQPVGDRAVAVGDDGTAVRRAVQTLRPHLAVALRRLTHQDHCSTRHKTRQVIGRRTPRSPVAAAAPGCAYGAMQK